MRNVRNLFFLRGHFVWIFAFLLFIIGRAHGQVEIPKQSDWTDHGVVITPGSSGTWDARLGGQISPCAVVKKNDTYFLYYIGADGDRSTDGGPRHRALGVATSTHGITFTKHSGNPIITFLPHNGSSWDEEEGVFSCGATLDENGNVVLYYSANTATNATSVVADVRLAVSSNGLDFTDLGVVIDHSDSSVWGGGDELSPVGTFHDNGNWYIYYIAKGSGAMWDLGLAWGPSRDNLSNTQAVLTDGSYIIGGGDVNWLGSDKIALFIVRDFSKWIVEVRTGLISSPGTLSQPVETYDFANFTHGTVFLDKELQTWFMYYHFGDPQYPEIAVKTTSAFGSDNTPPTVPSGLTATPLNNSQINLTWSSASDPESGIASYNIYRDGVKVGTSTGTSYSDAGLTAGTSYSYEVSAVNGVGLESERSLPASGTTHETDQLVISNLTVGSGMDYEIVVNGLYNGALVYIDRSFTYSSVPDWLEGATYIKTANDDKGSSGSSFISFDVNQDVTVYVAHDDRISTKPAWLVPFIDTGYDLTTTDATLSIFEKDFSVDTITFGGNEGTGYSMYTVTIVPQGTGLDHTPPAAPTGLRIISMK